MKVHNYKSNNEAPKILHLDWVNNLTWQELASVTSLGSWAQITSVCETMAPPAGPMLELIYVVGFSQRFFDNCPVLLALPTTSWLLPLLS